jgi:hypothetical protein
MASRYEIAIVGAAGTTGAAQMELRAASTDSLWLKEVGITTNAATATIIGLCKTPNASTLGSLTVGNAVNGGAAAVGGIATTWGTAPTTPSVIYRRIGLPAAIGNSVIWTFQGDGLLVPASSFLCLWNFAANSIVTAYWVWEE